jgi:hypothetical protein
VIIPRRFVLFSLSVQNLVVPSSRTYPPVLTHVAVAIAVPLTLLGQFLLSSLRLRVASPFTLATTTAILRAPILLLGLGCRSRRNLMHDDLGPRRSMGTLSKCTQHNTTNETV